MPTTSILLALLVLIAATLSHAQVVAPDAKVQKLADGMKFTEGPVWSDAAPVGGFLVFSDIPSNELKRWDAKNGLTTFRAPSHNTNGNTRDRDGRLISCEHSARRVTRTESDGSITVLAERFEGKKFNSPNDVVVKSDGSIWFTDPTYGTPRGEAKEIDGRFVYRIDPKTKAVIKIADGFDQPNGLCFSPDEKKLYIADSGKPRHIRVFEVEEAIVDGIRKEPDGSIVGDGGIRHRLGRGRDFCTIDTGGPDGIRCDERGNVWSSAGDGVHVFSPDGKLIERIAVPETPANVCFGGENGRILFITARTSLYSIPTNVRGAESRTK